MKIYRFILTVIIIAVIAQLAHIRLLFVLDYVLIALLVFAFCWTWLSLRYVDITRRGNGDRAEVGDYYEEVLTLKNRSFLPKLWLEVRDVSELPGHRLNCVQSLRPYGEVQWKARTYCSMRGRFRLGPVSITAGDPFGVFRFKRDLPIRHYITVYPPTFEINNFEALSGILPGGNTANRPTPHTTPNITGLREYRPGDSLNRIHWPTTARMRKLIVKEFDFDPTIDVQIFLDMNAANHWVLNHASRTGVLTALPASSGVRSNDSTEEYAVAATATLARHFLNIGRSVGFISWGQHHELISPDRGERQLNKMLEALAVIRAQGSTDFGQLIASEMSRLGSTDTVILVTSSTEDSWTAVLPLLLRKGVKVAVVMIEPSTFGGPAASPLLVVGSLSTMNVPVYLIKRGDDLTHALDSELARLAAQVQ
ncbi:MAG TPA: DUF58 domain-containing protein [Chloroflexia bacterium]|nr:DUF58 domain-containing protein [Chloroflexia bacterium]